MEIIEQPLGNLKNVSLILGFFDGIHLGHREVIKLAQKQKMKTVLLTFKESPYAYFKKTAEYIYPRKHSYKILENLGIDYLIEQDFAKLVDTTAKDYLTQIVREFEPASIITGFNHSFGRDKEGNNELIKAYEAELGYKYYSCPPFKYGDNIVSSTLIKKLISAGNIEDANILLGDAYEISGTVVKGKQLGRKLGYPTANINYPDNIVKLPYGVYKSEVFGHPSVLNWGIKPTVNGDKEGVEVHIIGFNGDLYGQNISVKILKRIRGEQKFSNLDELKAQIKKDSEKCLK